MRFWSVIERENGTGKHKMKYSFTEKISLSASVMSDLYGHSNVQVKSKHEYGAKKPITTFKRLSFSGFDYNTTTYDDDVLFKVQEPRDSFIFHIPQSGGLEIGLTRGQTISSLGPLAFSTPDCRFANFSADRREHRLAIERRNFLRLTPESVAAKVVGPLKFHQTPNIGRLAHALTSLIQTSYETFSAEEAAMDLKLNALGDMICSTLLNYWPNSFSHGLAEEERRIVPRQVKLAMDLIEADPFAIYSVHEIAKLSGVSVRGLQYGFSNFASCSLREFIFQRRTKLLKEAQFNTAHMNQIKAKAGFKTLKNINRLQEKHTGIPAVPWKLLDIYKDKNQ